MYALTNCRLFDGNTFLTGYAVLISENKIANIIPEETLLNNIDKVDLQGATLTAGFIDLQINGCGGVQFNDDKNNINLTTLQTMQKTNQQHGCCSFLPTIISADDELLQHAIEVMSDYKKNKDNEYQAIGLHIEGPYISLAKKGTHNSKYIRPITPKMINYFCEYADLITKITLAPEEVNIRYIKQLTEAGIIVSAGHSNASYEEACAAFAAGISFGTHLYNAMPPLLAREPGLVGAILDRPEIYASIIADGQHISWPVLRLTQRIKGDKLILVTDATAAAASKITEFTFAGKTIYYKEGRCIDAQGVLSGSALTMLQAIKNSVEHLNIPLEEALRMATLYPALAIKMDKVLGSITRGKIANLAAFKNDFQNILTIINGTIVYSKQ